MNNLYAPLVQTSFPAFYGNTLKIPFYLPNKINRTDFDSINLQLYLATNNLLINSNNGLSDRATIIAGEVPNEFIAMFDLSNIDKTLLIPGMFYQAKIAFTKQVEDPIVGQKIFQPEGLMQNFSNFKQNLIFKAEKEYFTQMSFTSDHCLFFNNIKVFDGKVFLYPQYKKIIILDASNLSNRISFKTWLEETSIEGIDSVHKNLNLVTQLVEYTEESPVIHHVSRVPSATSSFNPSFIYATGDNEKNLQFYIEREKTDNFTENVWHLGSTKLQQQKYVFENIEFYSKDQLFNRIEITPYPESSVKYINNLEEKQVVVIAQDKKGLWNKAYRTVTFTDHVQQQELIDWLTEYGRLPEMIGDYSILSSGKYTVKPTVLIDGLKEHNILNYIEESYTGRYTIENDPSEKVVSYQFNLYDSEKKLLVTSGWKEHNNLDNINYYESVDTWTPNYDFESGKKYFIEYQVKTIHQLQVTTDLYAITPMISYTLLNFDLLISSSFENGSVDLTLLEKHDEVLNGDFLIYRRSPNEGWEMIHRIKLKNVKSPFKIFTDYTVEQGKEYEYSIAIAANARVISNKIIGHLPRSFQTRIKNDFEDIFLYDGQRQLRIRFNSDLSSFKTVLGENKINTIGNSYPTIFRNGKTSYKDFSINGLITYRENQASTFMPELNEVDEQIREKTEDNSIAQFQNMSEIITKERIFKLTVLDWLNNGQPKLFRSSTEGNYVVQIINVSFSPEKSTQRILHNFSCNCVEIAEYSNENLLKYNLIQTKIAEENQSEIINAEQPIWLIQEVKDKKDNIIYNKRISFPGVVQEAQLVDSYLGKLHFLLRYRNNIPDKEVYLSNYEMIDTMGGNLSAIFYLDGEVDSRAKIYYSYMLRSFDMPMDTIVGMTPYNFIEGYSGMGQEVLSIKENSFLKLSHINYITCYRKAIKQLFYENEISEIPEEVILDPLAVYEVYLPKDNIMYCYNADHHLVAKKPDYNLIINDNKIIIDKDTEKIDAHKMGVQVTIGTGLYAIIDYQINSLTYYLEAQKDLFPELYNKKQFLLLAKYNYDVALSNYLMKGPDRKYCRDELEICSKEYDAMLKEKLDGWGMEQTK